jgi:signal transduction histidine kinase/DNA-binding NarL/FixJ family response regulator/tetratricopeptide (TPR) repeat protein
MKVLILDFSRFPFLRTSYLLVFTFAIINFIPSLLSAQSASDSLWLVWSNQQVADTIRLNALNELIRNKFLLNNPDSSIKLSNLQLALGKKIKSERHQGEALSNIGVSSDILGDFNAAMKNHHQALEIWNGLADKMNQARTINHIAVVHKKQGNYTKAIEMYMEALRINESIGNHRGIAVLQNNIGLIYYNQAYRSTDLDFRIEYLNKALERLEASNKIREEIGDKAGLLSGRMNLATVYFELRHFDKSKEIYLQCLELSRSMGDIIGQSTTLNNLGSYYHKMAELTSDIQLKDSLFLLASDYYKQSFVFREIIGNPVMLAGTYINFSILDRLRAEYKSGMLRESLLVSAIKNAEKAFDLAKQSGAVLEMKISSGELAQLYKLTGDFEKALFHYETYIVNRDSLLSETQKENIVKQELTYEFEKKAIEEDLKHQVELREQKNLRNTFIAGGALLFLLVLFVFSRYRIKQRAAVELQEKNEQVEAARAQAEQSEAVKQQFLANMSHEIRTPMNAITGLSRLLLDKPHDELTTNYLKAISHSSNNLLVVLNDILDFSKIEAGKLSIEHRAFDLRSEIEVLSRIFEARANDEKLAFKLEIENEVPTYIWGDSGRLSQILMNLLGNAVKFTESGIIQFKIGVADNRLIFKVIDSGPGIEPEKLPLIFDSFRQANTSDSRKFGGTGLGLTIAQNIARLMSGEIIVESEVGKGSTFSLVLPLIPATAEDCVEVKHDFANLSSHKLHVLVAEDNEYNFFVTRDTLLKYFPLANIIHVENGLQAVQAIEEDDYDLVLMDVQMPVMDGYDATLAIRAAGSKIPILGLTASVVTSDLKRCADAGMNNYIPKPFKDEEFISVIAYSLSLKGDVVIEDTIRIEKHKNDFKHYIPQRINEIRNFVADEKISDAIRVIHSIRPLLLNNGLKDLEKLCEEIELLSSNHSMVNDRITDLLAKIEGEIERKNL